MERTRGISGTQCVAGQCGVVAPAEAGATRPWPADQRESWPIEQLIRYANNPRLHSEADRRQNCGHHPPMGWTMPVLVGEGIFELYRRGAEAAAQRSKPQPAQTVPQPVSMEWFEAQKKKG
jgi:hypothetical protein